MSASTPLIERCPWCRRWQCKCATDGSLFSREHRPVEVDRMSTYPVYRCSCGDPACKRYEAAVKPEDVPRSSANENSRLGITERGDASC